MAKSLFNGGDLGAGRGVLLLLDVDFFLQLFQAVAAVAFERLEPFEGLNGVFQFGSIGRQLKLEVNDFLIVLLQPGREADDLPGCFRGL